MSMIMCQQISELQKKIKQQKSIFKQPHQRDKISSFPPVGNCVCRRNQIFHISVSLSTLCKAFQKQITVSCLFTQLLQVVMDKSMCLFSYEGQKRLTVVYSLTIIIRNSNQQCQNEQFMLQKCHLFFLSVYATNNRCVILDNKPVIT